MNSAWQALLKAETRVCCGHCTECTHTLSHYCPEGRQEQRSSPELQQALDILGCVCAESEQQLHAWVASTGRKNRGKAH